MKHFFTKLSLAAAFIIGVAPCWAQVSSPFGFEDNTVGGWAGTSSTETVTVNSTAANVRTGNYSLKMTTTSTGTGTKQWYSNTPFAPSSSPVYIHYMYWAMAANTGVSSDASFRYSSTTPPSGTGSSSNASAGVALTTTSWTRVTNNVNTSSSRYYFPSPRKTVSTGATSIYMDDAIIYTSASAIDDTLEPMPASGLTGTAVGNLVTLNWTSGVDTGAGATNVAATILLRAPATTTSIPKLNDQAMYSVAGGITGPNTVNGWTIISTTTGPTATTYLDAVTPPGNYIYATILQDSAYNYSPATISPSITAGTPIPVIFLNQTGFSGNTGNTVKGTISSETTYTINGLNLTGDITVAAPAGFQVSKASINNSGIFASSLTLTQASGVVTPTTIYVHYSPAAATGSTGTLNITNSSAGAATLNVPVSGNAIEVEPTTSGSISFGTVNSTYIQVNLPTVGNGSHRIIVMKSGSDVSFTPTDGAPVTGVNANFTQATDQGNGDRIIYDGAGSGTMVVTATGLTPSTTYYFAVYEYNMGTGTSQNYLPNSPVTALARTADHTLGIATGVGSGDIKVFPNPSSGLLFIDAPMAVNITITDLAGRLVYSLHNAKQANIESLKAGIYLLSVKDENGTTLKKEKLVRTN